MEHRPDETPDEGWRGRPDMDPRGTSGYRASIVARARFVEDLVIEQADHGVTQYVLLGAGLDTFAQRRAEIASRLVVYEVDRPGAQAWKRRRLIELGFGVPAWLRLVPVDFEVGQSWWEQLAAAGFDATRPAVVASTGVSMYLTREANLATLRQIATLAKGSTLAMTFLLTPDLLDPAERPQHEAMYERARSGVSRGPAHLHRRSHGPLLRRPSRRPAPRDRRGGSGRDDVARRRSTRRSARHVPA
jgi:methyltransferase (TIGR00027 family)